MWVIRQHLTISLSLSLSHASWTRSKHWTRQRFSRGMNGVQFTIYSSSLIFILGALYEIYIYIYIYIFRGYDWNFSSFVAVAVLWVVLIWLFVLSLEGQRGRWDEQGCSLGRRGRGSCSLWQLILLKTENWILITL